MFRCFENFAANKAMEHTYNWFGYVIEAKYSTRQRKYLVALDLQFY